MALNTNKEQVMNAISSLGFEVFKNGSFHWNSSNTPDMLINDNGSIHCWTSSPFKNFTKNHGNLIDFLQLINININFFEAKKEAYKLLNLELASLNSYKGYYSNSVKKNGFINKKFIKNFEEQRIKNFNRYKKLLRETLPSVNIKKQKELALKYQIGYIKKSNRLCMPIKNENGDILTLWKYNKNPKAFKNKLGELVKPNKVLFTKGRKRTIFNLIDLITYQKDKSIKLYLCAGEKDTLNMLGNGYRAITLGAENCDIPKEYLYLFKGLKIVVAYDYDKAGFQGTNKMLEQLKDIAKSVKAWDWEKKAKKKKLQLFDGFDMTNYLEYIKNQKISI